MTETQFDELIRNSLKTHIDDYIDIPDNFTEPHVFSKKSEKKMLKLIRKQQRIPVSELFPHYRLRISTTLTLIVLLSSMTVSIFADNQVFKGFLTDIFKTHTDVKSDSDDTAPEFFEEIYEITEVPEGFEVTEKRENTPYAARLYTYYQNDDESIKFSQWHKSKYDIALNTEGYEMESISVNGYEGFYIDWNDAFYIAWDNGDYIFDIHIVSESISKNALINIAESVKKVESS